MNEYFKDILGMAEIKDHLKTDFILPLYQPQLFTNNKKVKLALFYGPPGNGKTKIVHSLAKQMNAKLFSFHTGDILSKYVGESEKSLTNLFETVHSEAGLSILFLDEVDGVCRGRSDAESDTSRNLKTELLKHLSSFLDFDGAILIAATNRPWDIDSAFFRRFQMHLYFGPPDLADRAVYLRRELGMEPTCEILMETEGYSMADLENLVRNALKRPIRELVHCIFWNVVGQYYTPYDNHTTHHLLDDVEVSTVFDLPPGRVKVRDVNIEDLQKAVHEVPITVSAEEMSKFYDFQDRLGLYAE